MMMIGNGLQGTLLGVRASIEDFSVLATGIIMSAYYVGFLYGSYKIPQFIASVGHIRVFAAMASMASTTVLIHGVVIEPISWTFIRVLTGFSYAGLFLVVESWLNDAATNKTRGKLIGAYMVVSYLGMAAGQGLLNVAKPENIELFIIISILVSLALLPISMVKRPAPDIDVIEPIKLSTIWRRSPLGIFGVILSGIGTATIFSIGPVFAIETGFANAGISAFIAAFVIGAVVFQMPIAHLSDGMDRRIMIIALGGLSGLFSILLFFGAGLPLFITLFAMFLLGGASLTIYGQSISHVNDHLSSRQFVAASSTMLLLNAAGAVVGPLASTIVMQVFGVAGFAMFLTFTFFALMAFGFFRMTRSDAVPEEERGDTIITPARGGLTFLSDDD